MRVGVPSETKPAEFRVAITPAGVRELTLSGHEVLVQSGAGDGSSLTDADYSRAGATIVEGPDAAWGDVDLVLKVKEPEVGEHRYLRDGLALFTYLHLAASKECTDALLESCTTAIAYETVETASRALPLLAPMSEVEGRLAPQGGVHPPQPRG
jgi:alanine dehydrogenase